LDTKIDVYKHRLPVVGKIEIVYVDNGIAHFVLSHISRL
jgi:hypothetical protein